MKVISVFSVGPRIDFLTSRKIINTNKDKCVGCNKCIMNCPIKYANNIELIDGERKVEVDESRCISCGKCIQVCDHGARYYLDDADRFWNDLARGEKITIVVAPSFVANQYDTYKKIFGYFKTLGVNFIHNVAFGADITSWGYVQYLKNNENNEFMISQPCPSVVNYIERYATNLIPKLMPVQSPVACLAIYMKKHLGITDKIAFISPCIAKKTEIEKAANQGLIDYNIPFERLFTHISENNIDISEFPEVDFDNSQKGLGVRFSKPGGLKENVLYHLPNLRVKQLEGTDKIYEYLNFLNNGHRLNEYDLVDVLNCSNGCNVGTAACKETCAIDTSIEFENEILHDKRLKNQNKIEINFEEYEKLFKYFDETLDIKDFMVKYEDKSCEIKLSVPSEEELNSAFNLLKKDDEQSRVVNCYSCGYKTCKDMAIAIHNGYNTPSSCYQYNRKELEIQKNNLEESEYYIRTIIEHLSESVIVTNEEGFIEFVNKETEKLLGFSGIEYLNKHIQHFILGVNLAELEELTSHEFKGVKKNGETCDLRLEYSSIELKQKKALVFLLEDITKEKEIDNLKNNFVSMISHELRTPLTSIRGALGLVSSGVLGEMPDKVKQLLHIAGNNSIRLVNLINDILDLEKIKAGKMNFRFGEYQVMQLVEETLLYNNEYAKQYNVKFEIKERVEDALINVDKDKFIQILTNLLSNAAKFSTENEAIEIFVKRNKHLISLSVVNKGHGIPEESRPRIFEDFYQVDSSDTRKKGGSGLGLSICKSIVTKMGGKIGFESVEDDKTTFYFEFPEMLSQKTKKIALVVEDNKTTAFCIQMMLDKIGFQSDIALSAEDAQAMLKLKTYDLLTLDIVLPDKDGLTLLDEIRSSKLTRDLPVIIVSASDKDKQNYANKHRIVDWLEKSFDIEALQKTVNDIMIKKNQNKVSILHVEDDADILRITSSSLETFANITSAKSIEQAEKLLNSDIFDIIILDYKLPDGNCDCLIGTIRNSWNKNAKLIVFSAYDISDFLSSQVDAVILKSKVSNEQFCECIEKFVTRAY